MMTRNDALTEKEWDELSTLRNDLALLSREKTIPKPFRELITAARIVVQRINHSHDATGPIPNDGLEKREDCDHQWPKSIRDRWEAAK